MRAKDKFINYCIICNCASFTVLILIHSLFELLYIDKNIIIQFFITTTLISFLMYIFSYLNIKSSILENIIRILIVCVVVFGIGFVVFKWVPFEWTNLLPALLVMLTIYVIVFVIMWFKDKIDTDKINKIIKEKRSVKNEKDY